MKKHNCDSKVKKKRNLILPFFLLALTLFTSLAFASESHYIKGTPGEQNIIRFEACTQSDQNLNCEPLGHEAGYFSDDLNFRIGLRKFGAATLGLGEGILSAAGLFVASVWLYGTTIIYSGLAVVDSVGLITVSVGAPVAITQFDLLKSLNPFYWWNKASLLKKIRPDQLKKSDFYVNFESPEDFEHAIKTIEDRLLKLDPAHP